MKINTKILTNELNNFSTNINLLGFIAAILVMVSHFFVLTIGEGYFLYKYTNNQCSL